MTSQKKVHFDETGNDAGDDDIDAGTEGVGVPFRKSFKHSLDSDEEDDEVNQEKYNFMDPKEYDGEEEGLARIEGEIKFTAFNMREELEEGHFDKDGTYIFRKEKDDIKDFWVQNIDNCAIADTSKIRRQVQDEESQDEEPVNYLLNYKKMLNYMEKSETVQKAIQRLGKCIKDMRTKNRKEKNPETAEEIKKVTKRLEELTELADAIVLGQDIDIYEKKYSEIEEMIRMKENSVDMFADLGNDKNGKDTTEPKQSSSKDGQNLHKDKKFKTDMFDLPESSNS